MVGVIGGLISIPVQAADGWSVTVTPYVWATGLAGNITTLGLSASFAELFAGESRFSVNAVTHGPLLGVSVGC